MTATGFSTHSAADVWDRVVSKANHDVANSAGKYLRQIHQAVGAAVDGTVSNGDASATTTSFKSSVSAANDFYNDQLVVFTTGNLAGQANIILDYANTDGLITFDTNDPWTEAPADGDEFLVTPIHVHPLSQITEGVRAEMDASSTQLSAIVGDTNELQTNQGNWLTATGFSTLDAAGIRTAIGLAAANLDTQLGKADLTAALTEAYRSTGATGSAAQLLYEILAHLGEFAITSTTKTTKKLDGSTTAKTYTLDSDTNPTSITEST